MTLEMDRIAQEAFRSQNYEVALECFTELLSENGPKTEWLLGKADSLAKSGQLNDAFSVYAHAFRLGNVKEEQLNHLVSSVVDINASNKEQISVQTTSSNNEPTDIFTCTVCSSLLQEPATIPCGHTFCKLCLPTQVLRVCPTCKTKHSMTGPSSGIKTDVLLGSLFKLYFPKEVQSNEFRKEGNYAFKAGRHKEALSKYMQARTLAPHNPLILSNISHVNVTIGRYHEALRDAQLVCDLKPDWPKGYYRKGAALEKLGRLEEAMKAYLHCLMLNNTLTAARNSLAKVLHSLLTPVQASAVKFSSLAVETKSASYASASHSSADASNSALPLNLMTLGLLEEGSECTSGHEQVKEKDSIFEAMVKEEEGDESPCSSGDDSDCSGGLWCYSKKKSSDASLPKQLFLPGDVHASHRKKSSRSEERKRRRSQRGPMSPTRDSDSKVFRGEFVARERVLDPSLVKADDFECSLCMRLLYKPVTTPCGHTFCKECLYRSLDHSKMCPLCKNSLADVQDGRWLHDMLIDSTHQFLAERRQSVNVLTDYIIRKYLPTDFEEREQIQAQELEQLARYKTGVGECEIPVFVCTMAFPSIPCPLHVYEPRYRLMVRQCMQSGTKEFGMCPGSEDPSAEFADIGCMLEIEDVQHLPDGRSIIKTHGGRRFRVNSRGMRDGYNTAKVEFVTDMDIADADLAEVRALNKSVYEEAVTWYSNLPIFHKTRIADFFGNLPQLDEVQQKSASGPAWIWWMTAVLPVSPQAQLRVVSLTNVKDRLQALKHFIRRMKQHGKF